MVSSLIFYSITSYIDENYRNNNYNVKKKSEYILERDTRKSWISCKIYRQKLHALTNEF